MAKNVLIFSDGTGQAGGLMPDETRSNVYKLFRATRCGPDSSIDPLQQLSFYDPGLGSKAGGAQIKFRFWRSITRMPAIAVSIVITSAEYPATRARSIAASATSRPPIMYNWYQTGPVEAVLAFSSLCPETVERMNAVPNSPAARAAASSPSGCNRRL